jgi:putative transposase
MARIFHPFLRFLAKATNPILYHHLEFMHVQCRLAWSKCPKHITFTPAERAKLVKVGKPLGSAAIKELITIVTPRTFARWCSGETSTAKPSKTGRPRKPEEIRELIILMAKESGWGYTRILGELKKLGIHNIARSTIVNILRENGFDTGPKRGEGTWSEFIKSHAETLWACDFFTKKVWTTRGLVKFFVFFFIHIDSRKIHLAGITPNPDGIWMAQQARNLCMHFGELETPPKYIIRDGDGKFTTQFDEILKSEGIKMVKIPPRSPNLNAYAERVVLSIKSEGLDNFIVFGEKHLRYLVQEYLDYYHQFRPHQSKDNLPLTMAQPPTAVKGLGPEDVTCHEKLGGVLKYYERKAA